MAVQTLEKNRRPQLRVKNKGGAPRGNRNALKKGHYTAAKLAKQRAFKSELRTLLLQMACVAARANFASLGRKSIVKVTRIERTSPRRPNN